jgi:2-oxoglutarate/2-oxoacid ferredoxin oxidoreductase subunit alpha
LMLAIHSGHGEFARCVMSVSDSEDAFSLMNDAFNIAEEYQTPVIVMTDKHIAEGIYTQKPYGDRGSEIRRGKLITKPAELKKLKSADRYDPSAKDGISPRWLPGSEAATYVAQGDEHRADGSVDESAENAKAQMEKRMKKLEAMKRELPEPELFIEGRSQISDSSTDFDLLIVGWGSTKGAMLDVLTEICDLKSDISVGYLHYTYLWPLKTERFEKLTAKAKKVVFIEGNATGQLQMLLNQPGADHIRKYDGRPFFYNELRDALLSRLSRS